MKPLHPSALIYLAYGVVSLIQTQTMLRRLFRATTTATTTKGLSETWHVSLGRIGILILTIGTTMDNFRHFVEGFAYFWPDHLQHSANTAAEANELWTNKTDAPFLCAMFFVCRFGHQVLVPMSLVSLTQIGWSAIQKRQQKQKHSAWLCVSVTFILLVIPMTANGLAVFWNEFFHGELMIESVMGAFSLNYDKHAQEIKHSRMQSLLGVLTWQFSLLGLSGYLGTISNDKIYRRQHLIIVLTNMLCIGLQGSRSMFREAAVLTNLAEQIAILTNIVLDGLHNPVEHLTREKKL